jgi:hypothetical protein
MYKYIQLLNYWFGYVPSLVNTVEILAVRQVKQGIEAERFFAVQRLVQVTNITPSCLNIPRKGSITFFISQYKPKYAIFFKRSGIK